MSFDIGGILQPVIPALPGLHTAVTVHRIDDDDKHDTEPETNMGTNTGATQPRVIDALKQHGSLTREKLAAITGMDAVQLSNAIFNAKKAGAITVTGPRKKGVVSLAAAGRTSTPVKPAKAKPAPTAKPARPADAPNRGVASFAPPAPVRAIATADDGAILIRGTTVVAELDRAECAAVRELFCP